MQNVFFKLKTLGKLVVFKKFVGELSEVKKLGMSSVNRTIDRSVAKQVGSGGISRSVAK